MNLEKIVLTTKGEPEVFNKFWHKIAEAESSWKVEDMKLDEKIDNNSKEIDNLRNKIESLFCQTEKHEEKFSITIQDHLILRDVVTNNRSSLMSKIDEIEDDFTKKINDLKLFNKMISERTKENSE